MVVNIVKLNKFNMLEHKQVQESVLDNYQDWVINPIGVVELYANGIPAFFWKLDGNTILEKTEEEKNVVRNFIKLRSHTSDSIFLDDFVSGLLNTNFWRVVVSGKGSFVEDSSKTNIPNVIKLTTGFKAESSAMLLQRVGCLQPDCCGMSLRIKQSQTTNCCVEFGFSLNFKNGLAQTNVVKFYIENNKWIAYVNNGTEKSIDSEINVDDQWHVFDITKTSSFVEFKVDGISIGVLSDVELSGSFTGYVASKTLIKDEPQQILVDWIRLTGKGIE